MPSLAPEPDFRYVGLQPGPQLGPRAWASVAATGATLGAGVLQTFGVRAALVAAAGAAAAAFLARRKWVGPAVRPQAMRPGGHPRSAVSMAIVPWGVLVQPDTSPRILRWAAVRAVEVEMVHGRDGGSSMTLWSFVTIHTDHERLSGRAPGTVGVERLIAHVDAYAEEQAHAVALDLEGRTAIDSGLEPAAERLLAAARGATLGGDGLRLGLSTSYRETTPRATPETIERLRGVLRDRAQRSPDPRPLAVALAGELRAMPLLPDLQALVQSPHPLLAATAKATAARLGMSAAKFGHVTEVAPFLPDGDVDALAEWSANVA